MDSLLTRGKSWEADLFPSIQLLGFKTTHHFLRSFFLVAYSILYATNNLCVCVYICVDILMQRFGSLFTRLQTPPWQVQAFPIWPYSVCYCSQVTNPWWMDGLLNSGIPILRKEMWWPSEDMLPRESAGHKTRDILFPQAICLQSIVGGPQSLAYLEMCTPCHYPNLKMHPMLRSRKCISELTQEPPENALAALEWEELGIR